MTICNAFIIYSSVKVIPSKTTVTITLYTISSELFKTGSVTLRFILTMINGNVTMCGNVRNGMAGHKYNVSMCSFVL